MFYNYIKICTKGTKNIILQTKQRCFFCFNTSFTLISFTKKAIYSFFYYLWTTFEDSKHSL